MSLNLFKTNLFALFFLLLIGCSSNPASLDRNYLKTNKISAVNLTSPDKLLYEESTAGVSGGASGGFIGSLIGSGIDAAVNSRRAKSMVPILGALGGYDIRQALNQKLKGLSGGNFKTGLLVNASNKSNKTQINVLDVVANYTLSANHQYVMMTAATVLKISKDAKAYKRNFTARSKINLGLSSNQKINVTQYLIDNPAVLKSAIGATMDNIVKQIKNDINVGAPQK
jgi:hypothetical protein